MLPLFYVYVEEDEHWLTYNHVNNYREIANDILIIHRYSLPEEKMKIRRREFDLYLFEIILEYMPMRFDDFETHVI